MNKLSLNDFKFINIFTFSVLLLMPACLNKKDSSTPKEHTQTQQETQQNAMTNSTKIDLTTDEKGLSRTTAVLKTTKGTLKFKFYSKDAPNTVKRFIELIEQKFYDGLAFHRVVPNFVAQVGDPYSKNLSDPRVGTGGSGQKLKAEFNSRKHVRGTVAMARAAYPDSADSQFYICFKELPHLDNNYTVFGQIVDYGDNENGKTTLDKISYGDKIISITLE